MWKAIKEFLGYYDAPAAPKVQAAPKATKPAKPAAPKKTAAKPVKKTTKKNGR